MRIKMHLWKSGQSKMDIMKRMSLEMYDDDAKCYIWLTKDYIYNMLEKEAKIHNPDIKGFLDDVEEEEKKLLKERSGGFEKVRLKVFMKEDYLQGEIYKNNYIDSGKESFPYYTQILRGYEYDSNSKSVGLDKDIINQLSNHSVQDILLYEYNGEKRWVTTLKKYKNYGTERNGKVYLPVQHFDVYGYDGYADALLPKEEKFIKGTGNNEKFRRYQK